MKSVDQLLSELGTLLFGDSKEPEHHDEPADDAIETRVSIEPDPPSKPPAPYLHPIEKLVGASVPIVPDPPVYIRDPAYNLPEEKRLMLGLAPRCPQHEQMLAEQHAAHVSEVMERKQRLQRDLGMLPQPPKEKFVPAWQRALEPEPKAQPLTPEELADFRSRILER
jgi:hypothetical protein